MKDIFKQLTLLNTTIFYHTTYELLQEKLEENVDTSIGLLCEDHELGTGNFNNVSTAFKSMLWIFRKQIKNNKKYTVKLLIFRWQCFKIFNCKSLIYIQVL